MTKCNTKQENKKTSRGKKHNKRRLRKRRVCLLISSIIVCGLIFKGMSSSILNSKNNLSESDTTNEDTNVLENVVEAEAVNNVAEKNLDGFLFIGDSFTALLKDTIHKFNPSAIVKAVSGVQPVYWNDNFNELPDDEDVNGVVLLIGVNGAAKSDNLPNKKKLITSLVEKYKDKTIYVQEVFPVGANFKNANPESFNKAIKNNNEETKKYCDLYDNVVYIDATKDLVTEDGYLKYTNDELHIMSDKQETFYNNILEAVKNS